MEMMTTDTCDYRKTERLSPGASGDWLGVEQVGCSLPVGVSLRCLTHGWKVQMAINSCLDRRDPSVCLLPDSSKAYIKWRRNYYWRTMESSARWVNWPIKLLPFNFNFENVFLFILKHNESDKKFNFVKVKGKLLHVEPSQCLLAYIVNGKSLRIPMAQAASSAKKRSLEAAQRGMYKHKLREHL